MTIDWTKHMPEILDLIDLSEGACPKSAQLKLEHAYDAVETLVAAGRVVPMTPEQVIGTGCLLMADWAVGAPAEAWAQAARQFIIGVIVHLRAQVLAEQDVASICAMSDRIMRASLGDQKDG